MANQKKNNSAQNKTRSTGSGSKANSSKKGNSKKEDSPKAAAARAEIHEMQEQRKRGKRLYDVIWGLVYCAVGAFIFGAVKFEAAGEFGNALGEMMKGLFGLIGMILPWYLIVVGILLIAHLASHFSWKSFIASIILILMICLINSGRFIDAENLAYSFGAFYNNGITLEGGGLIGMSSGTLIVRYLGKSGLYIFCGLISLICLLLILNNPITSGFEKLRDKREERRIMKEKEAEFAAEEERAAAALALKNAARQPVVKPAPREEIRAPLYTSEPEELKIITPFYDDVAPVRSPVKKDKKKDKNKAKEKDTAPLPLLEETQTIKSNVLDFMKNMDPFAEKEHSTTRGLEESYVPGEGYGLGEDEPDLGNYDVKKASAKEIAKGAAAIGADLGLKGGSEALTKSVDQTKTVHYKKPPVSLLNPPVTKDRAGVNNNLKEKARLLEETLRNFNVDAKVVQVTQGPAVTRYEIQPAVGVKVSKIVSLSDDIALNLKAKSIRIEAPIPGKAAVGIEIENDNINMVTIREIIDSKEFKNATSKIEFAVGKDIAGKAIVADLKGMPHLLIAGSTGSGKSVCINSIITSILYRADPDEVKLVLIDPKVVELGNYNGIPHLLIPVVTEPSKAAAALSWAVVEMTNRYKLFAEHNVRDLSSYNKKVSSDGNKDMVMPQVVIIIDELADLMMAAPSQVEESICRLAQMARAAGMHLIVATQRPSVDIITGLIKANIPSRIAFAVSSQFDSRTILDMAGAEKLVGKGDMLFNPLGMGKPVRVQGCFISDEEVENVINYVKSQGSEVEYSDEVLDSIENGSGLGGDHAEDADELLPEAIECVVLQGQASVSMLQRRFRIGYNRAARIVDQMEARGIVGPQDGSRPRQVLISEDELAQWKEDTKGM